MTLRTRRRPQAPTAIQNQLRDDPRMPRCTPRRCRKRSIPSVRVTVRRAISRASDSPDLDDGGLLLAAAHAQQERDHQQQDAQHGGHGDDRVLGGGHLVADAAVHLAELGLEVVAGDRLAGASGCDLRHDAASYSLVVFCWMRLNARAHSSPPVSSTIRYGIHDRFPVNVLPVSVWSARSSESSSRMIPMLPTIAPAKPYAM